MIRGKIKSFLAVFISLALFCSTIAINPVAVYAGGDGEDYGESMTLRVNMVDCDDFGNASVSVYRQEDSQSQKEYIGYYCVDDDETGGTFEYTRGDILTFYVYDPPENLVTNDTLYYVYNNFYEEAFGKGTDPMGCSDCYMFTLNTATGLIYNDITILYNYAQVEDFKNGYTSADQYCVNTANTMTPQAYGPGDDGKFIQMSSSTAGYTVSNGWGKFYIYSHFSKVAYSIADYQKVSGMNIDGQEYPMDLLEELGYASWGGSLLMFDLSIMMPALAANGKDDPKAVTISPVYSETETVYGEFILDFHETAGSDTYVDVIQENANGNVTATTSFSKSDWDENGQCRVAYRQGERVKLRVGKVPDDASFFIAVINHENRTIDSSFGMVDSTGIGEVYLEGYLDDTECPTVNICFSFDQYGWDATERFLEINDTENLFILELSEEFTHTGSSCSADALYEKSERNGRSRWMIQNFDESDRLEFTIKNYEYIDSFRITVFGGSSYTGTGFKEEYDLGYGVDYNPGTGELSLSIGTLAETYLDNSTQGFDGYYNCIIEPVYADTANEVTGKVYLEVENGAIYRTGADGVMESSGSEVLDLPVTQKQMSTLTLGEFLEENGLYTQELTVKGYQNSVSDGWYFIWKFFDIDPDDPYDEGLYITSKLSNNLYQLSDLYDQPLSELFTNWGKADPYVQDIQRLYLQNHWFSKGSITVDFITNGYSFRLCGDEDAEFETKYDDSITVDVNGIDLFSNRRYYTSIEPVNPDGFLGWYLCVPQEASDGTVTYTQVSDHLYSTEDIKNYVPTLEFGNHVSFVSQWDLNFTKVHSISATVDDMIYMNFFVFVPGEVTSLVLNGPQGEVSYDISSLTVNDNGLYKVSYEIPPACMDEEISIKALDSEGEELRFHNEAITEEGSFVYTLRQYLLEAATSDSLLMENVILAMNTYGLYAQDYFGISLESQLPELDDVPEHFWSNIGYKAYQSGTLTGGVEYYGSSLILQNGIRLRHYFTKNPGTVKLGTTSVTAVASGPLWYVETPKISIKDAEDRNLYKVTIGGWKLYYSVLSYCSNAVLKNTAAAGVATALYQYYCASVNYQGCEHDDSIYTYIGNGQHATYCPHCGEIYDMESCDEYRDDYGVCSCCESAEEEAVFEGMSIISVNAQGKERDSSYSGYVYEGDTVTVSESFTYPDNKVVNAWKAHLYMNLPSGQQIDLMQEDTELVDVINTSMTKSADGKKAQISVTFYAKQQLEGISLQFGADGYREFNVGESELLEALRSETKTINIKDALTMGILENLSRDYYFVKGETGAFLSVKAYAPGTVSYQWQYYIPGENDGTYDEDGIAVEDGTWENIQGASRSSYYLGEVRSSMLNKKYRCVIQAGNKTLISQECTLHPHYKILVRKLTEVLNLSSGEKSFDMHVTNATPTVLSLTLADGTVYDSHEAAGLINMTGESDIDGESPGLRVYEYTFTIAEEAQYLDLTGATLVIGWSGNSCSIDSSENCSGMHKFAVIIQ